MATRPPRISRTATSRRGIERTASACALRPGRAGRVAQPSKASIRPLRPSEWFADARTCSTSWPTTCATSCRATVATTSPRRTWTPWLPPLRSLIVRTANWCRRATRRPTPDPRTFGCSRAFCLSKRFMRKRVTHTGLAYTHTRHTHSSLIHSWTHTHRHTLTHTRTATGRQIPSPCPSPIEHRPTSCPVSR